MKRAVCLVTVLALAVGAPALAAAEAIAFKVLSTYSRATFKSDAPLETIVGNTTAVAGTLTADPAKPQDAKGTIRVDLTTLKTGIDKRDQDMMAPSFFDIAASDANKVAVFELRGIELAAALEHAKQVPAKIAGVLTIKGKAKDVVANGTVTYFRLTPEQVEAQKRFGFTSDNIKVRATFGTTFTDHGMQVPQLLVFKLSNEIALEADITFVRQ
jgi:polyisoprenoid-binding protein YceI